MKLSEITAAPHIVRELRDGDARFFEIEPLKFFAVVREKYARRVTVTPEPIA